MFLAVCIFLLQFFVMTIFTQELVSKRVLTLERTLGLDKQYNEKFFVLRFMKKSYNMLNYFDQQQGDALVLVIDNHFKDDEKFHLSLLKNRYAVKIYDIYYELYEKKCNNLYHVVFLTSVVLSLGYYLFRRHIKLHVLTTGASVSFIGYKYWRIYLLSREFNLLFDEKFGDQEYKEAIPGNGTIPLLSDDTFLQYV